MHLNIRILRLLPELSVHIRKVADCDVSYHPVTLVILEPWVVFLHLC